MDLIENQPHARARRLARRVGGQVFSETRAAAMVRISRDCVLVDRRGALVFLLTINGTFVIALGS